MTTPSIRHFMAATAVVLGIATSAGAVVQGVSDCDAFGAISGHAVLTRDIDCSGSSNLGNILIERGRLDLNGHTIVTGSSYGIFCGYNCKIIGPGTITGSGSGIGAGSKSVFVKDVTISVSGGIGVAAGGRLTLDGVTITGPVNGAYGGLGAKIVDSTITAQASGIRTGLGYPDSPACAYGDLIVRRSSITGTTNALCGSDPEQLCADIVSCRKPKLSATTCNTSCQNGSTNPCPSWGICAAD